MTPPDPLDQLLRAAELQKELAGLDPAEVEARLQQNEDLRELVEPMLREGGGEQGAPTPTTERVIGDFRLVREIGRGGMGIVFEAWQESLNRRVALKLLSPALGHDPASVARFHREATLAAGLSHPSLASIYGFQVEPEGHCLVMEFIDGVPCDQILGAVRARGVGNDPLAAVVDSGLRIEEQSYEQFVVRAVAEIAEALQHAHDAGVIHRDVKPANVIIRADGRAVLTDFGLARETGREGVTVTGESTGTPAYQSPEQVAMASVELGPLTDVFSLGVTLYELLTGEKPFDGDTVLAIQHRIVRSQPADPIRLNPQVSRDLVLVLRKAMQKRPGDRYASAGALAEDLRRFAASEVVHARPMPAPVRFQRWCAQNPLLAGFLGMAFVAAVAITVFWWQAETALADYRWLAAGLRVESIRRAHDQAPPAWPEHEGQYRDWLAEAEVLRTWLPMFRDRREELRALGREDADGLLRFDNVEDEFLFDGNSKNLEALEDVENRVLPELIAQLEWTQKIRRLTVDDHRQAWDEVARSIAADERFAGFELAPQIGLVPMHRDPDSELWEFTHLRSGAMPERGADGRLVIDGGSAIVFVLVPPTRFLMGCQGDDVNGANYDERARGRDGPVHEVVIGRPFFLSKYELSRGQWRRLGGVLAVTDARDTHDAEDLDRYPLIGQSHDEVRHRLHRFGLVMPTESQWEACCRAESMQRWSSGTDERDLVAIANIRDLDLFDRRMQVLPPTSPPYAQFRDGYARLAPVGALLPNAFGFHQMHGNVDEQCRDNLTDGYVATPDPVDGYRIGKSTVRVVRGGSNLRDVFKTASGIRNGVPPGARIRSIGCRPARPVFD